MSKQTAGKRFNPPSAGLWQDMVDAGRSFAADRLSGGAGRWARSYSSDVVLVKNESGATVNAFDILALDTMAVAPSDLVQDTEFGISGAYLWQNNLVWSGLKPDLSASPSYKHIGRFGVLLETLVDDAIGHARVAGLQVAQLAVSYADHPYADVADATHRLTTNWYGAAEIVYKEQVTTTTPNEWWGLVHLGHFQSPPYKGVITESGGIAAGGNGEVSMYFAGADTLENVTAYLDWMDGSVTGAVTAECLVRYFRDEQKWQIVELECPS